jgi:hypothetical protein
MRTLLAVMDLSCRWLYMCFENLGVQGALRVGSSGKQLLRFQICSPLCPELCSLCRIVEKCKHIMYPAERYHRKSTYIRKIYQEFKRMKKADHISLLPSQQHKQLKQKNLHNNISVCTMSLLQITEVVKTHEKQITIFLSITNLNLTHSLHNKSSIHETENSISSLLFWFQFHCKFFEFETGKFEEV